MDNKPQFDAPPRLDSHRENKKARLRQQLMELAVGYMLSSGYEKLSLTTIAQEANVSSRTVLRYFESKAGLVTSPCTDNLQAFRELINDQQRQMTAIECWQQHISEKLLLKNNNKLFLRYVLAIHSEPALAAILSHVELAYQNLLAKGFAQDQNREVTLEDKYLSGALLAAHSTTIRHWIQLKKEAGLKSACLAAAQDTFMRYKKCELT